MGGAKLKVVPGSDGRVAEAVNCPVCEGGNTKVQVAGVEVDFPGPAVVARVRCSRQHVFYLRLGPGDAGRLFLTTLR